MLTLALAAAGCGRFGFDPAAPPGNDAGGDGAGLRADRDIAVLREPGGCRWQL